MTQETNLDIIQTSRRFFGFALSDTPEELYEQSSRPKPSALAVFVTDYLIHKATDEGWLSNKQLHQAGLLFTAAIDDTHSIIMQNSYERPVPLERIQPISRDERTITTIARLAMHQEEFMKTAISPLSNGRFFQLNKDMSHIKIADDFVDSTSGGCPFASSADHSISPDPLFRRTVHLAGDLIYLAYKK